MKEPEIENGAIYLNPATCRTLALVYICKDKYGILYIEDGIRGRKVPGFQFSREGEFMFTVEELKVQFNMDKWLLQEKQLKIVEDEEM